MDYSTHNEEIEQALHSISINLKKLENELFNIQIRDEINVPPMRSYIEEWLQRRTDKLIDEGKQLFGMIAVVFDESIKNASSS